MFWHRHESNTVNPTQTFGHEKAVFAVDPNVTEAQKTDCVTWCNRMLTDSRKWSQIWSGTLVLRRSMLRSEEIYPKHGKSALTAKTFISLFKTTSSNEVTELQDNQNKSEQNMTTEYAASKQHELASVLQQSYEILFDNPSDIFLRTKPLDILFRGVTINCSTNVYAVKLVCDFLKRKELASKIVHLPNNMYKISIFGSRNGTVDPHVFTVMRGIKNVKDVGRVVAVDGEPRQHVWRGQCDEFVGTDGTVFPPFLSHKEKIIAFSPDFCRYFKAWFEKRTSYQGIRTNRYILNFGDLANDPELQCFCDSPDQCPQKGLMELSKCTGARIFSSLPHFLDSSPFLYQNIKGLKPDVNLHGMEIDFEPSTRLSAGIQNIRLFNIQFKKVKNQKGHIDAQGRMKNSSGIGVDKSRATIAVEGGSGSQTKS
ncbi:Sensory neuron membrane protein 1 [Eumeta japonica]|uniref:Sensory neuron membrane protein 1 n=1 Tax=Eumeta variegata TaxID=151549 RepID=A0A4C1VWZ4_EUMVA|nr:Sensory neuron membrane protein 1 [Eumeta japonica]